jgi:hypothetical protein
MMIAMMMALYSVPVVFGFAAVGIHLLMIHNGQAVDTAA